MCDLVRNQVTHKLSYEEFTIICTIHQEPNYCFTAGERKAGATGSTLRLTQKLRVDWLSIKKLTIWRNSCLSCQQTWSVKRLLESLVIAKPQSLKIA